MNQNPRDLLNLASKITIPRAWNAAKVLSGFYYSRITRQPANWGLPISISFEPTTSCNLRCPECPSGLRSFTRPTGMLDPDFFKSVIDQLHKEILYLTFYFQGEPFLHPEFPDMVKYAAAKKIYTATSTNAHYLDYDTAKQTVISGLDRLIISIDGTTQETYEQYRIGGQLQRVLEGARNIVRWKKELKSTTPHVIFQFLVVSHNEHEIEGLYRIAKETGVNEVALKTAQVYEYKNGNTLIPQNEKYSRYQRQSDGTFKLKNKLLNHCWKLWQSCVVTWDGNVVPCCFDKDAAHKMGSLREQSFAAIWQNKEYKNFRTSLLQSRSEIDICRNCTEGTKVWA